jgi:tetratricopeptide (TPR) repeat protein
VLEVLLTSAPAEARLPILRELAALRESLGETSLAFAATLQAFALNPADEQIRAELERLAADTGSFEELAGAYEDRLEQGTPEVLALDLWRRLASIQGERLGRPDLAARALEEVSRRAPRDLDALDALSRLYREANAFRELAEVMRRQVVAQPSVEEQVGLLFELGNLAEEQLHDQGIAAKCYGAILERKPTELSAYKLLGRVLQESERHPELAQLLEREIQLAEARGAQEEALDLMVRLARLRAGRLNDPRGALETFRAVLSRNPQHAGAAAGLEELARSESALRGEAASLLEPVLATGGDHLRLVQMMEARLSTGLEVQERVALLRRMAELYAGPLDSPEQAFITAARALREQPEDAAALDLCIGYAHPADAEDALVDLLEEVALARTTPGPERRSTAPWPRPRSARATSTSRWRRGGGCWSRARGTPKRWRRWVGCWTSNNTGTSSSRCSAASSSCAPMTRRRSRRWTRCASARSAGPSSPTSS